MLIVFLLYFQIEYFMNLEFREDIQFRFSRKFGSFKIYGLCELENFKIYTVLAEHIRRIVLNNYKKQYHIFNAFLIKKHFFRISPALLAGNFVMPEYKEKEILLAIQLQKITFIFLLSTITGNHIFSSKNQHILTMPSRPTKIYHRRLAVHVVENIEVFLKILHL